MGKLKPRSLAGDGGGCLSNWVSIEIVPHSAPRTQSPGLLIYDYYHHLTPSKVGGKGEQPTGIYVNCTFSPTMCCAYRYMLQVYHLIHTASQQPGLYGPQSADELREAKGLARGDTESAWWGLPATGRAAA